MRTGLMAGSDGATNTVYLAETTNGGKSWSVRERIPEGSLYVGSAFVATAAHGVGFFTYRTCVETGGYPYTDCTIHAMTSLDGGSQWSAGGPNSVDFSFLGQQGWAIEPVGSGMLATAVYRLQLGQGGSVQQSLVTVPCSGNSLGPAPTVLSVAPLGGQGALLVCGGPAMPNEAAVTYQAKTFYRTANRGQTWTAVLNVPYGAASPIAFGGVRGMAFLADGQGWLWTFRGYLDATADGGQMWAPAHVITELELETLLSASLVGDGQGYALVQSMPKEPLEVLMETTNGGQLWSVVRGWPPPSASRN